MKKQIIILFILIIHLSTWSQKTITTTTTCTDEELFKTPGRWIKGTIVWQTDHIGFNKVQQQEVLNRMDAVHQPMLKIYLQPLGLDAAWSHTLGYSTFGDQVSYVRTDQFSLDRKAVIEKPVASFGYVSGFFRHYCNTNNLNEIWSGYPGETGTFIRVFANAFAGFAKEYFGNEDSITIGSYPVHLRQPLKQKFDGYDLFYSRSNVYPEYSNELFVLLHRKGELPYIPVTRKQYLDKCIAHLTKSYDRTIKDFEQVPMRTLAEQEAEKKQTLDKLKKDHEWNPAGLKAAVDYYLAGYKTEQEIRKEQVAEMVKQKDVLLKNYRDELEETTNKSLLDSPAIIPLTIYNRDENLPIFVEENIGWMLVTANPKYMRKELPKYAAVFCCGVGME